MILCDANDKVSEKLATAKVLELVGPDNSFDQIDGALAACKAWADAQPRRRAKGQRTLSAPAENLLKVSREFFGHKDSDTLP